MITKLNNILGANTRDILARRMNLGVTFAVCRDKMHTKGLLSQHDIAVTNLLDVIENNDDLLDFDFSVLPHDFVIKPSLGKDARGLNVFVTTDRNEWMNLSGKKYVKQDMLKYIADIIDGLYNDENVRDVAMIEEVATPPKDIQKIAEHGIPDIQVLCYRKVPVMAMMRIPTEMSRGMSVLRNGAIGVGLSLSTGAAMCGIYQGMDHALPADLLRFQVNHWNNILLLALKSEEALEGGFVSVDMVIDDKKGPLVTGVSARPSLDIQLANHISLGPRLKQLENISVSSIEEGLEIGKELFHRTRAVYSVLNKEKVLGATEEIRILSSLGIPKKIMAKIDTGADRTSIDIELFKALGLKTKGSARLVRSASGLTYRELASVSFFLGSKRVNTAVNVVRRKKLKFPMIIGRRDLRGYLVDPSFHFDIGSDSENLKSTDTFLADLAGGLSIVRLISPVNIEEQKKRFFASGCKINPVFEYPYVEVRTDFIRKQLDNIPMDLSRPIGVMLNRRRTEVLEMLDVIDAMNASYIRDLQRKEKSTISFEEYQVKTFTKYCKELYTSVSADAVKQAKKEIKNANILYERKNINATEAKSRFVALLHKYGLRQWDVVLRPNMVADLAVTTSTKRTFYVREGAVFSESQIAKAAVHEIFTHIFRTENGLQQPYEIMLGSARYLKTEEGLALYNEMMSGVTMTEKSYLPMYYILAVNKALGSSFVNVFAYLKDFGLSDDLAWLVTCKSKRGLFDTSLAGAYTKDALYFEGYLSIKENVRNGREVRDLYYGKIGVDDIDFVREAKTIAKPKYVPHFYGN